MREKENSLCRMTCIDRGGVKITLSQLLGLRYLLAGFWVIALAAAILLIPAVTVETAEQKSPEAQKAPASAPSAPSVIPLADVAQRATEVSLLLHDFATKLAPSSETETIRKSLSDVSRLIDYQLAKTMIVLRERRTLGALQSQQQQWEQQQLLTMGWLSSLTAQATKLQDALNRLADLQGLWTRTRLADETSKAPGPIQQQIYMTLSSIAAAQTPLQGRLNEVFDLQSRVAGEVTKCGTALAEIDHVQRTAVKGIFAADSLPLWSAGGGLMLRPCCPPA